jgi:hypothetical protein
MSLWFTITVALIETGSRGSVAPVGGSLDSGENAAVDGAPFTSGPRQSGEDNHGSLDDLQTVGIRAVRTG